MKLQSLLPALAITLLPSSAMAFEYFTVGVGGQFQAGGNFLDKPDDQRVPFNGTATELKPKYPGFAGLTLGGGPYIDLRAIDYVGVEMGLLFTTDKGTADIDVEVNGQTTTYTVEIKHSAIHIPLLLKGTLPGEIVSPNIFVGPEFVVPSGRSASVTPANNNYDVLSDDTATALGLEKPGGYTMVTFGLGLEFNLPIPVVDIRIPFSLRGSVNPGVSNKRTERSHVDVANSKTYYSTEWKFQAVANLGASIHF